MARSSDATILSEIGTDITEFLQPSLISVSVTQRLHGRADEMDVRLEDRDGLWRDDWKPSAGDQLSIGLEVTDWKEEGDNRQVGFGVFEIDGVALSGPPATARVKAQSAAVSRSMRKEQRTQAWQDTDLKTIAGEIAARHDLELRYASGRVPSYERLDQSETPDLKFLRKQAERFNLKLRVDDERLILVDDSKLKDLDQPVYRTAEENDAIFACKRYELEERTYQMARKGEVTYDDPVGGDNIKGTAEDTAAPDTAETLKESERVGSEEQAALRAAGELERNNEERFVAPTLEVPGRLDLRPGFTVPLEGFGRFDGRYVIDEATHEISRSGYTTTATLRKKRKLLA